MHGKTKFVSGFLKFFGKENEVSSPTFTIVNEYNLDANLNLYHFDVYRLNSVEEFINIGGEELIQNGISLIEWGELVEEILPSGYLKINIEKDADDTNKRIFNFSSTSKRFNEDLKEAIL